MTEEPISTGIQVQGTALTEEETAALLAVINTQLVTTPPVEPPVDHSTRNRVISTWANVDQWQIPSRGA